MTPRTTKYTDMTSHTAERLVNTILLPPHPEDLDTVLILAGDIQTYSTTSNLKTFWQTVIPRFKNVVYIPGNHEFYHGYIETAWHSIAQRTFDMAAEINCGDKLLMPENDEVGQWLFGNTAVTACILWSDMNGNNPVDKWTSQTRINDYYQISSLNR